jgi:hypothetical protein
MDRTAYDKRSFRRLSRDTCVISELLGDAASPCQGLIHRHHVDPTDERSRTVPVCNVHHQYLHTALRSLLTPRETWKRCRHRHTTKEGREACERRLNRVAA